jgi:hypothetical protein
MIEIKADKNGKFSTEAIDYLKGQYLFTERIKKRGVGSSKVVYASGVKAFDNLLRGMDTETAFVSFELQRNGLIARLNINQRLSCVGLTSEEIESINLTGYPTTIGRGIFWRRNPKIIHYGKLEIILSNETLGFTVRELEFKDILKYFGRDEFTEKFRLSIDSNSLEKT